MAALTSTLQLIDTGLRALLFSKFQTYLKLSDINEGVIFYPKNVAWKEISQIRGQQNYEFISYWRTGLDFDWSKQRTAAAKRGIKLAYKTTEKEDVIIAKAVPVRITYDIHFWSKYRERIMNCIETWLFWQQTNPNLSGTFDGDYTWNFDLHMTLGGVVDESEIEDRDARGWKNIFRAPITIDGWVFAKEEVKTVKTIIVTFYDSDDLSTTADYESIVVEDSGQDTELESILRLSRRTITSS